LPSWPLSIVHPTGSVGGHEGAAFSFREHPAPLDACHKLRILGQLGAAVGFNMGDIGILGRMFLLVGDMDQ